MSTADGLGPVGVLVLTGIAIVIIAVRQPVSMEVWGISMNWIVILILAFGGVSGVLGS